jgi:hypothetical protein
MDAYTEVEGPCQIWTPALKSENSQRPDGEEATAWMVQFMRGNQLLGRDQVHDDRFRAVLALNIHGPGSSEPLRLQLVRRGVTVFAGDATALDADLSDFAGCSLLLACEDLDTDLTGLEVVQNQKLLDQILQIKSMMDKGHLMFQQGADVMTIC